MTMKCLNCAILLMMIMESAKTVHHQQLNLLLIPMVRLYAEQEEKTLQKYFYAQITKYSIWLTEYVLLVV